MGGGGTRSLLWCAGAMLAACASTSGYRDGLAGRLLGGIDNGQHDGPMVSVGASGTARFTEALISELDVEAALDPGAAPAVDSAKELSEQIARALKQLGFGEDPRLELLRDDSGPAGPANSEVSAGRLVATMLGNSKPDERVVLSSPLRSPDAHALLVGVRALRAGLASNALEWPARSISWVWVPPNDAQDEPRRHEPKATIALLALEVSQSTAVDVGVALCLERGPDPGALCPLGPDRKPTAAAPTLNATDLEANGLAIVARSAIVDVGVGRGGEWRTLEQPFRGGPLSKGLSESGIPSASFRLSAQIFDEPQAAGLSCTAPLVAALALADASPLDFDRYLKSLSLERRLRLHYAREAEDEDLEEHWGAWFAGARHWLRRLCHGISMP